MSRYLLIIFITFILSGCEVNNYSSNQTSTNTDPTSISAAIESDTKLESGSPDDQSLIDSFQEDQDNDFSAEFSQLESDLQ